jgi:hypothetical protein
LQTRGAYLRVTKPPQRDLEISGYIFGDYH